MALDTAVLAALRSWVGTDPTDPTDADLEQRHGRLGNVEAVALEILRGRLADMVREPARFQVDGDAGWSYEKNLEQLRADVAELTTLVAATAGTGAGVLSVGRLVRAGRGR